MKTEQISLDKLKLFAELVEYGSFTLAADKVGCSKSYISKCISSLEHTLDCQLLHRSTRRLTLTQEGESLLPICSQLRTSLQSVKQTLDQFKDGDHGLIRLIIPTLASDIFCSEILPEFHYRFPKIQLELINSDEVNDIFKYNADLAIYIGLDRLDNLEYQTIYHIQDWLCASPCYLQNHSPPTKPKDLIHHQCITSRNTSNNKTWSFFKDGIVDNITVNSCIRSNGHNVLKMSALQGMGLVRLPFFLVKDDVKCQRLVRLLPEYQSKLTPVSFAFPQGKQLQKKAHNVISFVKDKIQQLEISSSQARN